MVINKSRTKGSFDCKSDANARDSRRRLLVVLDLRVRQDQSDQLHGLSQPLYSKMIGKDKLQSENLLSTISSARTPPHSSVAVWT